MGKRRTFGLVGAVAVCFSIAAVMASNLGAQAADGSVANFTPGKVKLLHTGGSQPNGSYANLGRLTLPVGSWVITAHTVLVSSAPPTGVDCYLLAAGTAVSHTPLEILGAKNQNIQDLSLVSVTTAPSGGPVDLLCKVSNPAASRRVIAQDTSIVAVSVAGATVTHNPAPPFGSY